MNSLILASSSPRRRELLTQAGIPFTVVPSSVDEANVKLSGTVEEKVEKLAYLKAADVAKRKKDSIVLGADTVVVCDGLVFGKPADEEDAERMLRALSGREHTVITGVALVNSATGDYLCGHESTKVKFAELKPEEIRAYIRTGEPYGKAGAYAVQGKAAVFVESLEGCYSNVVGLPLRKLYEMLREFGIEDLWQ